VEATRNQAKLSDKEINRGINKSKRTYSQLKIHDLKIHVAKLNEFDWTHSVRIGAH